MCVCARARACVCVLMCDIERNGNYLKQSGFNSVFVQSRRVVEPRDGGRRPGPPRHAVDDDGRPFPDAAFKSRQIHLQRFHCAHPHYLITIPSSIWMDQKQMDLICLKIYVYISE